MRVQQISVTIGLVLVCITRPIQGSPMDDSDDRSGYRSYQGPPGQPMEGGGGSQNTYHGFALPVSRQPAQDHGHFNPGGYVYTFSAHPYHSQSFQSSHSPHVGLVSPSPYDPSINADSQIATGKEEISVDNKYDDPRDRGLHSDFKNFVGRILGGNPQQFRRIDEHYYETQAVKEFVHAVNTGHFPHEFELENEAEVVDLFRYELSNYNQGDTEKPEWLGESLLLRAYFRKKECPQVKSEIYNLLASVDRLSTEMYHTKLFNAKGTLQKKTEERLINDLKIVLRNIIVALTAYSLQFADYNFLTKIGTLLDVKAVGLVESAAHAYTAVLTLADSQDKKMEDSKKLRRMYNNYNINLKRDNVEIPIRRLFRKKVGFGCYGYFRLENSYKKLKAYLKFCQDAKPEKCHEKLKLPEYKKGSGDADTCLELFPGFEIRKEEKTYRFNDFTTVRYEEKSSGLGSFMANFIQGTSQGPQE